MSRIHPAPPAEIAAALAAALDGGPPLAPLSGGDDRLVLDMLAPDEPAEVDDLAVVVATSGSTGAPKGVLLSRSAIRAAVGATHEWLGGAGDWTLAVPEHYVAGLMVTARTLVARTRLHRCSTDLSDLPMLSSSRPQYLSLVPTQLVRALSSASKLDRLAGYDAILLGGAAAPDTVLDRARAAGLRIVTTYGMSETCGGCVYDGHPLPGVTIQPGSPIHVQGPMLFSGYRRRPDLTAETLRNGWLVTRDRGRISDGRLVIDGRIDDVVISGGVNVDLAEVEAVVASVAATIHGRPVEVAVVGVPDAEWGVRVVAVTEALMSRTDLSTRLSGAQLPRQVVHLPRLPRTPSGKIDRQQLIRSLQETTLWGDA